MTNRHDVMIGTSIGSFFKFSGKSILDCNELPLTGTEIGYAVVFPSSHRIGSRRAAMLKRANKLLLKIAPTLHTSDSKLKKFAGEVWVGDTEYTIVGIAPNNDCSKFLSSIKEQVADAVEA